MWRNPQKRQFFFLFFGSLNPFNFNLVSVHFGFISPVGAAGSFRKSLLAAGVKHHPLSLPHDVNRAERRDFSQDRRLNSHSALMFIRTAAEREQTESCRSNGRSRDRAVRSNVQTGTFRPLSVSAWPSFRKFSVRDEKNVFCCTFSCQRTNYSFDKLYCLASGCIISTNFMLTCTERGFLSPCCMLL